MVPNLTTRKTPECRRLSRRQVSWRELSPRVKIIDDPKKMADLIAERKKCQIEISTTADRQFQETYMEHREEWMELCELATREADPRRLIELTSEIVRLLDEKRKTIRVAERLQESISVVSEIQCGGLD
jgi:hypothetical protein